MNNQEWRFPSNNYDVEKGLDTADMETFKKDPIASLAREICQNSIDARRKPDEPVRVEFSYFSVDSSDIPGISRITKELKSCLDYWAHSETIKDELNRMLLAASRNKISVLRISDFNTTGLVGVSDSLNKEKPWYLLTKGSGISLKEGAKGGSKGIGKFSTFVASSFNTVFYATKTQENEEGYQGIAKFASTYSLTNPDEKTSGNGYYSSNEKNQPILETFCLDKSFVRESGEYGTDVYILGFDMINNWESSVISKILESFMVAIIRNNLEVIVNKQLINYSTVGKVIDKGLYIRKKDYNIIQAQYELLTAKNIFADEFEYEDYGKFELRIKSYSHQESSKAVNNCLMVRYPYMKIKTFDHLTHIPHSAICIIGDNELNRTLRKIENPQHTDWETNRVKDSDQKKIVKKILTELKIFISEKIREYLLESDHKQSDIEGASEYLPDEDEGDYGREKKLTTHVSELKKNKSGLPIGQTHNDDSMGLEPDIGGNEEDEEGGHFEEDGDRQRKGDKPIIKGSSESGEATIFKASKLDGIKHRFYIIDKINKVFKLIINSPVDEKKCMISIYSLDDMNKKSRLNFKDVKSQSDFEIKDGNIHFELKTGYRYTFEFQTDFEEKFSAEVIFYAIR